jgi:hypothetical protein
MSDKGKVEYSWEGEPTEGLTVHPTHTCFDDALDYIEALIRQDVHLVRRNSSKLFVVHGICLKPEGPTKGEPFAHAWVEDEYSEPEARVWQGGILNGERIFYALDRVEFFQRMRVQECTRYTLREASDHNHRTNHYGPWLDKYKRLCREG